MQAVSNKQWALMRSAVTAYYPDVVSFYAVVKSYDRYGVETTASGLALTVSGQLNTPSGNDREIISALKNQGVAFDETIKLTLPYGTPVSTDYTAVTADSKVWDVSYVNTTQTFTAATDCILTRSIVNGTTT